MAQIKTLTTNTTGIGVKAHFAAIDPRVHDLSLVSKNEVRLEGQRVIFKGQIIATLEEGVRFDVLRGIFANHEATKANKDKLEKAQAQRAALAIQVAKLVERANVLERSAVNAAQHTYALSVRVRECEDEVIEVPGVPVGDLLRSARERGSTRWLSEAEAKLDKFAWRVFDLDSKLSTAGGHYVLQNVIDDIIALHPQLTRHDLAVDIEDIVASALRWCRSRSRLWLNTKCWIIPVTTPIGEFLVLKRNRYVFQIKEAPENAITEI